MKYFEYFSEFKTKALGNCQLFELPVTQEMLKDLSF